MIAACSQEVPAFVGSINAASKQASGLERLLAVEHKHSRYMSSASVMLCCHGYYRQALLVTTASLCNAAPCPNFRLDTGRCEAYR